MLLAWLHIRLKRVPTPSEFLIEQLHHGGGDTFVKKAVAWLPHCNIEETDKMVEAVRNYLNKAGVLGGEQKLVVALDEAEYGKQLGQG